MQKRSPTIFWLLLAATISVDAVVVASCWRSRDSSLSVMLALGLAFGELSALCVWTIFARPTTRLRWLFAYSAATLAAVVIVPIFPDPLPNIHVVEVIVGFALFFWLHVSLVLGSLWITKQLRFSHAYRTGDARAPWQVSMFQLLIVTTILALTMGLYNKTTVFTGKVLILVSLWCVVNAALATCGVLSRSRIRHIAMRLAAFVGIAIGSCVLLFVLSTAIERASLRDISEPMAAQIIQAAVLFVWMECVPIVPTPDSSPVAVKRESTSTATDIER